MDEKQPVHQDIEVLPADIPHTPIGFTVREYLGSALRYYHPEAEGDSCLGEIIKNPEDLQPGMTVIAWKSMLVTVTEVTGTKGEGTSNESLVVLAHGEDDRQCWVANGVINLRGVTKLKVT